MEKVIDLRQIGEEEYRAWLELTIREYAEDKVRAGNWTEEESLKKSEEEFRTLLTEGPATPGHTIFSIFDPGLDRSVGLLWVAVLKDMARPVVFIYDLVVYPDMRGHGYGEAAMRALEGVVCSWGMETIRLHVFGHNLPARALYEKLGYLPTNIGMVKQLNE